MVFYFVIFLFQFEKNTMQTGSQNEKSTWSGLIHKYLVTYLIFVCFGLNVPKHTFPSKNVIKSIKLMSSKQKQFNCHYKKKMDKSNRSKLSQFLKYNTTELVELTEEKHSSFTKCMSRFISNIKMNNLCTRLAGSMKHCAFNSEKNGNAIFQN